VRSGSYDWNLPRESARGVSAEDTNGSQVQADKGVRFICEVCERKICFAWAGGLARRFTCCLAGWTLYFPCAILLFRSPERSPNNAVSRERDAACPADDDGPSGSFRRTKARSAGLILPTFPKSGFGTHKHLASQTAFQFVAFRRGPRYYTLV
jgi:hypothetical protein